VHRQYIQRGCRNSKGEKRSQRLDEFEVFNEIPLIKTFNYQVYSTSYEMYMGTAVAQWLRYCVTNRKVAGSIPAGVTGIFH